MVWDSGPQLGIWMNGELSDPLPVSIFLEFKIYEFERGAKVKHQTIWDPHGPFLKIQSLLPEKNEALISLPEK